jgi:hypothetical protein
VHRDIKPENLLLDKEGRVKIADFGIAKMLDADGSDVGLAESQPVGTPQYMAPEQKAHRVTDHRADIYSLGVVLYELPTGEFPAEKLQPPSHKVQIDVRLDEIVLRALEKSPELRYQTAVEFHTQVETIAATPAPPATAAQGSPNPPEPEPGWTFWSPFQTQRVREICAHMTETEKREMTKRGLLFGLWNAGTFFGPLFSVLFLPAPLGWIYGIAILAIGLSFYPLLRRMQREFLCATAWARQHGLQPDQLKGGAIGGPGPADSAAGPARFSRTAIVGAFWIPLVLAAAAFIWFEPHHDFPYRWNFTATFLSFLSLAGLFGTTILGWVAVTQIRRSARKLHGMWLAVFDGLFFPLLALDLLIATIALYFCHLGLSQNAEYILTPGQAPDLSGAPLQVRVLLVGLFVIGFALIAWIDFLVVRKAWRAVNRTADKPHASQPSLPNTPRSILACCVAYSSGLFAAVAWMLILSGQSAAPWAWCILITALLGMTLAIGVQRTSCGKQALWFGGAQVIVWIFFAVFFLLHDFSGIPGLQRVDSAGVMQRSPFPKAATITRNAGTVLVVHDNVDAQYVFFAPRGVGTTDSSSCNNHSLAWMDNGTFKLTEQWTFGYLRESTDPVHLKVNGKEYDLRQGRVFLPHDDGTLEQRQLEVSLATVMDPEAMAKLIANPGLGERAMRDAKVSFGPVIEREVDGAIDFDSGKVVAESEKFSESNDIAENVLKAVAWLEREGTDAITEPSHSLKGVGLKAKAVDQDAWDKLTPEEVTAMLEMTKRETWQNLDPNRKTDEERKTPATWIFETREGGKGILQVLEHSQQGVKVRYKLVPAGATNGAVVAPPTTADFEPATPSVPTAAADDPTTLGPESNGLRAGLELRSKNTPENTTSLPLKPRPGLFMLNDPPVPQTVSFVQGEPIEVLFHIHNTSGREISIWSTKWRQDDQSDLTITDEKGHRLVTRHVWYSGWPVMEERRLKPGEGTIFRSSGLEFFAEDAGETAASHPVGNWVMAPPGRYTVKFRLRFPDVKNGLSDLAEWRGELETAPVTIEVKAPSIAKPSAKLATSSAFGPAIERVLPQGEPCLEVLFQFRSGEVFIVGNGPGTSADEAAFDQKRIDDAGGVDMSAISGDKGIQIAGRGCFFTQDVPELKWDRFTAEQAVETVKNVRFVEGVVSPKKGAFPITYLFKTARGEVGIMEVLGPVEVKHGDWSEKGMKFRYKLVQGTGTTTITPSKITLPQLNFGKESHGLQAALAVTPGEPFGLRIYLRNVSDKAIALDAANYRQEDKCLLTDADGKPVPITRVTHDIKVGMGGGYHGPGQIAIFESAGLSFQSLDKVPSSAGYVAQAKPGHYTLRMKLRLPGDDVPFAPNQGVWHGELETGPVTIEVRDPATQTVAPVADGIWSSDLGKPVEITMNDLQTTRENCALSLDTGKLLPVPASITLDALSQNKMTKAPAPSVAEASVRAQEEALTWARTNQVDAVAFVTTKEGKVVKCGLLCPDLLVFPVENKAWTPDLADARMLKEHFEKAMHEWNFIPRIAEMASDGDFPATYLILDTRTHRRGVLQILGTSDKPRGVKISYRLIEGAAVKKITQAAQPSAAKPAAPATKAVTAVGSLSPTGEDGNHWMITAYVAEEDILSVERSQSVEFSVGAFPQRTFHGRVWSVNKKAEIVQNVVTFAVHLDVTDADPKFQSGMTANVVFVVAKNSGANLVPQSAVESARAALAAVNARYDYGTAERVAVVEAEQHLRWGEAMFAGDRIAAAQAKRNGASERLKLIKAKREAGFVGVEEVAVVERELAEAEAQIAELKAQHPAATPPPAPRDPLSDADQRILVKQYEKTLDELLEVQKESALALEQSGSSPEERLKRDDAFRAKIAVLEKRRVELRAQIEQMMKKER